MEIRPVVAELFHANGQTDMTKLIVTFCNAANAPKNCNYRLANSNAVGHTDPYCKFLT